MTVETQGNKKTWIGDGSTTVYAYPYPFQEASNIEVYLDNVKQTSGFSVQVKSDYSSGANITFTTAPASEKVIVIRRMLPITQEVSYPENGEFPAKSHEKALDKLTLITIDKEVDTIKMSPGVSETVNLVLPIPVKGKAIKVKDDGTGFEYSEDNVNDITTASIAARDAAIAAKDGILNDPGFIAVAGSISNINTVADNETNINTVAGSISNINTVAADELDIGAVAGSISNINTVAADLTNIDTVSQYTIQINDVGTNILDVENVSDNMADVIMTSSNETNINTVAVNISGVQTCSANISAIQTAPTNAVLAKQYAVGLPSEPSEGSAKYWAGQAAQGQIQADWAQTDNTKKDYIKNKPTLITEITTNITITSSWVGDVAPYSQEVSIPGILNSDNPIIGLIQSDVYETALNQMSEYSKIFKGVSSNGSITFYADEPTSEQITLQVKIIR